MKGSDERLHVLHSSNMDHPIMYIIIKKIPKKLKPSKDDVSSESTERQ